jgi:hypothetical protein
MTIEQLKKHVDRRLRTTADKADVRRLERRMDERFGTVESRLGAVESRLDGVESRLGGVESRLGRVERGVDSLGEKLDYIAGILNGKFDKHERVVNEHEDRLRDLEAARLH